MTLLFLPCCEVWINNYKKFGCLTFLFVCYLIVFLESICPVCLKQFWSKKFQTLSILKIYVTGVWLNIFFWKCVMISFAQTHLYPPLPQKTAGWNLFGNFFRLGMIAVMTQYTYSNFQSFRRHKAVFLLLCRRGMSVTHFVTIKRDLLQLTIGRKAWKCQLPFWNWPDMCEKRPVLQKSPNSSRLLKSNGNNFREDNVDIIIFALTSYPMTTTGVLLCDWSKYYRDSGGSLSLDMV